MTCSHILIHAATGNVAAIVAVTADQWFLADGRAIDAADPAWEHLDDALVELGRRRLLDDRGLSVTDLECHMRKGGVLDLHAVFDRDDDTSHAALKFVAGVLRHALLGEDRVEPDNYRCAVLANRADVEVSGTMTLTVNDEAWRTYVEVVKPGGRTSHEIRAGLERRLAAAGLADS